MNNNITYRELFEKLKGLGYSEQIVKMNGHRHRVFRHNLKKRATIFLPYTRLSDHVSAMHKGAIQTVFLAHDVNAEGS